MSKFVSRHNTRLPVFNYATQGSYFITICVHQMKEEFGTVMKDIMHLNEYGAIAASRWQQLSEHFLNIELDEFIAMPNHIHGIIIIKDVEEHGAGLMNQTPTQTSRKSKNWQLLSESSGALGKYIRYFKAGTARVIRQNGCTDFRWQRNYYEHVIRNERDLFAIRRYIHNNPMKWELDDHNLRNHKNRNL